MEPLGPEGQEDMPLPPDPPQTAPRMPPANERPQSLTLETWAVSRFGAKHVGQVAGFARWATANGHERNSQIVWNDLLSKFNNTVVR